MLDRRLGKMIAYTLDEKIYSLPDVMVWRRRHREWVKERNSKCDLASPQEITDCIVELIKSREGFLERLVEDQLDQEIARKKDKAAADENEQHENDQRQREKIDRNRRGREQAERNSEFEDDRSVVFHVRSSYQYRAQVEFSSKSWDVSWPGNGQAYSLNNSQAHKFKLSCVPGEKICMGAWAAGNSRINWGVGYHNAHGCTDCCTACGSRSVAAYDLEYLGHGKSQQTSGISAADLLGAAIGVAGAVAGSGGVNQRSSPSYPAGPRTRDSGVSGGR